MLNARENAERMSGGERAIAVAINKDKSSQSAFTWAANNLVTRDLVLKLVHVKDRQNAVSNDHDAPEEQQTDSQTMDFFLPFRCFCRRRQVRCETVLLEDSDVARALIGYVYQYGVDTLLLGGGSKNGLTRLFKTADIPGTVLKRAPSFCTVYVVSKGKVSGLRTATRPVPASYAAGGAPRNSSVDLPTAILDEVSAVSLNYNYGGGYHIMYPDSLTESSERPSTDTTFFAFYENLGKSEQKENLRKDLYMDDRDLESTHSGSSSPVEPRSIPEFKILDSHAEPWLEQNEEGHEDEIRMLKIELKQTIDMYRAACNEALAAKQKVMELEHWKIIEEKRVLEARLIEETSLKMVEWEKAKSKAANETAEAAQMLVEIEVQKRIRSEKKALKEADEKKKVLDVLGQSQIAVKHQSLLHMIVVVLLFYFYFNVFK
ncbi:ADENINE NUCLEOTIDE ALPHA HYDROLASES-LIKE SUPERFAMILY PROTEIN [Salix koriyanagi]|uniref:RING-type E3 ubiquitin transferase n=1 Tax=Salix koriyanagi TaxID=2511006 RepID=A0A9Q0W2K2_9ROSI|nr:ADENINE NUCLEOTIDE ALPHA HYDROLASES-LIKE SUPERFAMILY PROTEIN [Salix koriyanagi]